jgi:DNA polymerase/3'-5' exonuclease PolX
MAQEIDTLSQNKKLADVLALISSYYSMDRDTYRSKAYASAASKIGEHPTPIISGQQARQLPGIGPSIEEVVTEYLTTGHVKRLEELEEKYAERKTVIDYFRSFYGIGPVTAVKYYNQGLRTVDDLWARGNLTDAQKVGVMWSEHIKLRIARSEMDLLRDKIASILDVYGIKWNIAGSYRRQEESSGDIDVLVQEMPQLNMAGLVALLQHILPANLALGPTKYMGIVRLSEQYNGHRIDIRLVEPSAYAAALMYFTGSQRFNILMRNRAISFGLTLNEYGLFDNQGRALSGITSEEAIFQTLRVQYLAPVDRTRGLAELTFT